MKITLAKPAELPTSLRLPVYASKVPAGFPSPADDYIQDHLDLNEYLVKRPASTFFAWASGRSMINAGILDGALLVVDRSLQAEQDDIVIVAVDGELTCKLIDIKSRCLRAANLDYKPIPIGEETVTVWGVVVHCVNRMRPRP